MSQTGRHRHQAESRAIRLCNYDADTGHRVRLAADGFEVTYRLRPGDSRTAPLPAGEQELVVEVDGRRTRHGVGGAVLVEIGNGVVSVTEN